MVRIYSNMQGFVVSIVVAVGAVIALRHAAAFAPPGRYTIQSGTVIDAKTGLTWQRTIPAPNLSWNDAQTYCQNNTAGLPGTGWRLPSVKELQTLVDETQSKPAIDLSAFSFAPSVAFWTSSSLAGGSSNWYVVNFAGGGVNFASGAHRVRCVR